MLPVSRAVAFALAVALLGPLAAAQVPSPNTPEPPPEAQCQAPVETCFPDLVATNPRVEIRDERFPAEVCTDFVNLGEGPTAAPFRILLVVDGVGVAESQATGIYRTGEGESNVCWENVVLSAGRHTLVVTVDSDNEVIESNEDNNERGLTFSVRAAPRVDLRLTSLEVTPREGGVGTTQVFVVNVTNIGDGGSPLSVLALEDDHGSMANWSVPPLAPGQSFRMAHATRPEYRPVGTFVARATIDPADNVSEIDEENNEALASYTVLEHPEPDYNISKVTITGNRSAMRGLRVDVQVDNIGDRGVQGTTVRLVNNATNKTLAQGVTRNILYPGDAGVVQFYLTLKAGTYDLLLVADPNNKVIERNESNNAWPLKLEIADLPAALDRPNLLVERVYAMPEDPRPGEAVSVGALVHNVGVNKSNATSVSFYVDDEPVGTAQVPALAPDAYHSAYVPWVATTAAAYRITAAVDVGNRVAEIDEDDNALDLDFLVTTQRPPQEPTEPPPVPPTVPTEPLPTTPTPTPGPTPPAPTNVSTASRVTMGELVISTTPVPGGLKGVISVSLRNPNIQNVGLMTVQFKIDDELLVEKLVAGIRGAGTTAATTGEVDLPPGKHKVTAEVRIVGSTGASLVRDKEYEAEAGPGGGIPGFEPVLLLAALAIGVAWRRRA